MASLSAGPASESYPPPELAALVPRIRIEPPHGLFELRVRELWAYRELLYFFVWRDLKVRYKQTVVGVAWVVIQPFSAWVSYTIFLDGSQNYHRTVCHIRCSISQHWLLGHIFRQR